MKRPFHCSLTNQVLTEKEVNVCLDTHDRVCKQPARVWRSIKISKLVLQSP